VPKLIVIDRSGGETVVDAQGGVTLMEAIRDNGFDDLLALCGGCCSCATCHVFVDRDWAETTGAPGEDENDLLDSSDHRSPLSRLSCQIVLGPTLDGLRITIAPED